jgi:hypothetical protein
MTCTDSTHLKLPWLIFLTGFPSSVRTLSSPSSNMTNPTGELQHKTTTTTESMSSRVGLSPLLNKGLHLSTLLNQPDPDHEETVRVLRSLRSSPSNEGFSHLAIDGVYRSFSSKGEVVDYKKCSPEEISMMLSYHSERYSADQTQMALEKFHGVDGRTVTDLEQLLHPNAALRQK